MYPTKLRYPPKISGKDKAKPNKKMEKNNFLNGMTNVHNRGPKHLRQKEEREKFQQRDQW